MNEVQCLVFNSPARPLWTRVYGFFYGVYPSHTLSSSFPAACCFSPAFSGRAQSGAASVLSFLPPVMFQAEFTPGPTCSSF